MEMPEFLLNPPELKGQHTETDITSNLKDHIYNTTQNIMNYFLK